MHIHDKWPRVTSLLAVTMSAFLLAVTMTGIGSTATQAAVGPCHSDPVVVLTNLKTLDLTATVNTDQSSLQSVNYTLHLPSGVRPLLVVPTDGLVGQVEHFTYVNDEPSGHYADTTEAFTTSTVQVTASALGILVGSGSASGPSNQPINIQL